MNKRIPSPSTTDADLLRELQQVRRIESGRLSSGEVQGLHGYEILREVRRGGQGLICEAIQQSTGRRVALKILLHGTFSSVLARARFQQEVELLASLQHPAIVSVFDFGEIRGEPFYAMDYIDGTPLTDVPALRLPAALADREHHVKRVLKTMAVVAEAVACFQRRGLIHRDLKPENILIDQSEQPRIVDFGLARRTHSDHADWKTVTGEFVGTPAYASPEQVLGDPARIDIRTDVYSLGVILFELLTGRLPVDVSGTLLDTLRHVTDAAVPRLSGINAAVDRDTETIVMKCLSREPERRYQSASELAADIRRRLDHLPIHARADSVWYLVGVGLRRHRPAVAAVSSVVVILLVATVVSFTLWRIAVTEQIEARAESYRASLLAADAASREARTQDAFDMLERAPTEFRGWEWHYVRSRVDNSVSTFRLSEEAIRSAAWSADGSYLAFVETTGGLGIRRFTDAEHQADAVRIEIPPSDAVDSRFIQASFRPHSTDIACLCETGTVRLFDYQTQHWTEHFPFSGNPVQAICWEGAGHRLFGLVQREFQTTVLREWRMDSREGTDILTVPWSARCLTLTPDGTQVVLAGHRCASYSLGENREMAEPKFELSFSRPADCITIAPDGLSFACGSADGSTTIVELATGQILRQVSEHTGPVSSLAFSDDSSLLAAGCHDSLTRIWEPATGRLLRRLKGQIHWIQAVRLIGVHRVESVSALSHVKQFRIDEDPGDHRLSSHQSVVTGLEFTADGDELISSSMDGEFRLQSIGLQPPVIDCHQGPHKILAFAASRDCTKKNLNSVVAAIDDGSIRFFDRASDGLSAPVLRTVRGGSVMQPLAIATESGLILAGLENGEVLLLGESDSDQPRLLTIHDRPVRFAAFALNHTVAVSEDELDLRVVRIADGKVLFRPERIPSRYFTPVAVDGSGELLAAGDSAGRISVWNLRSQTSLPAFQWHASAVTAVCFSPDGKRLVSAASDGAIKIWNTERHQEVFSLPDVNGFAVQLTFSPDGKRLAAGLYDGSILLFEALPAAAQWTR